MSTNRKQPWGRVYAVVPNLKHDPNDAQSGKSTWLELGVAWLNEKEKDGQTSTTMRIDLALMPVQWLDPNCPRIIDVQKSQPRKAEGSK